MVFRFVAAFAISAMVITLDRVPMYRCVVEIFQLGAKADCITITQLLAIPIRWAIYFTVAAAFAFPAIRHGI